MSQFQNLAAGLSKQSNSLKNDLDWLVRQEQALQADARKVLGQLAAVGQAAKAARVHRLNLLGNDLKNAMEEIGNPLLLPWDHDLWSSYQPVEGELATSVRIGGLVEPGLMNGEKAWPDVPEMVPILDAAGPIILVYKKDQSVARSVLQSLILRIAFTMPTEVGFTLIDPVGLGAAFPFSNRLSRVRRAGRTTADELSEVQQDIRRINESVVGQAARFADLTTDQRAGEHFEIIAVTDFPVAYMKDPRAVEALMRIGASGPRTGRHLLLEYNASQPLPHDFSFDSMQNAVLIDCDSPDFIVDGVPSGAVQAAVFDRTQKAGGQRRSGDWDTVVRPERFFTERSSRRVATSVGERLRVWFGDDDDGKPSAHAIAAGQTGSGKSYMFHVMITGLAARYSPDELQFVLIDGKQGVEFEAYRNLPHAAIVCLRTTPAMARSVLSDFVAEMEDRYEAFQASGVAKFEEYREKTGKTLARKLMIVDEYQQLLDGDPVLGSQLILKLLEKGRAAGTHVCLGSQTFGVQGLPPAALTHVHTRISLSLAQDYVQSLQVFGAEGKRLIRELAPSGQVVINDESGRDGGNARGAVARFRRDGEVDTLADTIEEITRQCGQSGQAVVVSGRDGAVITDNAFVCQHFGAPPSDGDLEQIARKPLRQGGFGIENWTSADRPIGLWLGRRFDVHGHALCALRRAPMQNVLILGSQVEARNRMLASAFMALPSMVAPDRVRLVLIDGLRHEMPGGGVLRLAADRLRARGADVQVGAEPDAAAWLSDLATRAGRGEVDHHSTLLVIAEPDYLYCLQGGADRFAPPSEGPAADLRTILSRGPQSGIHTLMTGSGLSALGTVLSPSREARLFNHRVVQQMNEDDSMVLFAALTAARINAQTDHPNACLMVDVIQGTKGAVLFNSYTANHKINADQGHGALTTEFDRLAGGKVANVA